jgi:hypothetical protein
MLQASSLFSENTAIKIFRRSAGACLLFNFETFTAEKASSGGLSA